MMDYRDLITPPPPMRSWVNPIDTMAGSPRNKRVRKIMKEDREAALKARYKSRAIVYAEELIVGMGIDPLNATLAADELLSTWDGEQLANFVAIQDHKRDLAEVRRQYEEARQELKKSDKFIEETVDGHIIMAREFNLPVPFLGWLEEEGS